jgi:hypothetical protein
MATQVDGGFSFLRAVGSSLLMGRSSTGQGRRRSISRRSRHDRTRSRARRKEPALPRSRSRACFSSSLAPSPSLTSPLSNRRTKRKPKPTMNASFATSKRTRSCERICNCSRRPRRATRLWSRTRTSMTMTTTSLRSMSTDCWRRWTR